MDHFVRCDSTNLPKLDTIMILEFMNNSDNHNIAEIRGAKALMSSRESYVDTAVGYVEVKRCQDECIVRAKVVPEHRVSVKQYVVNIHIDEKNNLIKLAHCDSCPASAGGCKHTLVLLFWLEKRSSEPPSTSVQCYWKKPSMSGLKSNPIKSEDVFPNSKKIKLAPKNPEILTKFLDECKNHNATNSLITSFVNPKQSYNIFDLTIEYLKENDDDFERYLEFLNTKITPSVIHVININTLNQVHTKLWHSVRQGRITASKIFEASRCKTDGTLVQQILGGYKIPETLFMKRGKKLESLVIKEIEKEINKKIEPCGFILINGIVGASPDGIGDDFIVEIKCPGSKKNFKQYVDADVIKSKYIAQMQTQMLAANKKRGLFCVADPSFEETKKIFLYWVEYDHDYTHKLINQALMFWRTYVYRKIVISAKT